MHPGGDDWVAVRIPGKVPDDPMPGAPLVPAPCTNPPALPCTPTCRGWLITTGNAVFNFNHPLMLGPCPDCEHWYAVADVIHHITEHCPACADLAVANGVQEPLIALFEGLTFDETPTGWTASVTAHGRVVVRTAAYPSRDDARAAGNGWLRRMRGLK